MTAKKEKLKMARQGDVTLQTASGRKTDDAPDEELFGRRKPPEKGSSPGIAG
jgi:hypothetical protein